MIYLTLAHDTMPWYLYIYVFNGVLCNATATINRLQDIIASHNKPIVLKNRIIYIDCALHFMQWIQWHCNRFFFLIFSIIFFYWWLKEYLVIQGINFVKFWNDILNFLLIQFIYWRNWLIVLLFSPIHNNCLNVFNFQLDIIYIVFILFFLIFISLLIFCKFRDNFFILLFTNLLTNFRFKTDNNYQTCRREIEFSLFFFFFFEKFQNGNKSSNEWDYKFWYHFLSILI